LIEALAHDLGKVTPARFDDHATASMELLRGAGFDDKFKDAIIKMHSEGFEIDGFAYQTGLPGLHIKLLEKVLSKTLRREVLADGISR